MRSTRPLLVTALHVGGLWAIAVVQPLLDVLGRAPEFFVAHRAGPSDLLLLLAGLLLVAPLVPIALVVAAGVLGPRVRSIVTATIVAILVGLVAVQVAKQLGVTRWTAALPPAVAAGVVTALLYARFAGFRSFFTVLGTGILIVPAAFALQPGIRRLIVPNTSRSAPADPAAAGFRPAPIVLMVFDELPLVSLLNGDRNIDPAALSEPLCARARRCVVPERHDGERLHALGGAVNSDGPAREAGRLSDGRRTTPTRFSRILGRSHQLEVYEPSRTCAHAVCVGPGGRTRRGGSPAWRGTSSIVAAYVFLTPDLHERLQLPDLTTNWAGFSVADDFGAGRHRARGSGTSSRSSGATGGRCRRRFMGGISAVRSATDVLFLHVLLPHQPWMLLPTGQRNGSPAPLPSAMRVVARNDDWEIAQNQQRHLLQVGYVDHAVGRWSRACGRPACTSARSW